MQLNEPASDLAVCAALVSSFQNKPIDSHTLVIGEVGLAGEVRAVGQMDQRLAEAAKMGFQSAVLPKSSARHLEELRVRPVPVESLAEALEAMSL
jgi:DNA repair protein RadA/Sms